MAINILNKMDYNKLITWLKDKKLYPVVEQNYLYFVRIFRELLKIDNENIFIMGDLGYESKRVAALMLGCYSMAAEKLGLNFKIGMQDPKLVGEKADSSMIQEMLKLEDESVLAICVSGKIGAMDKIGKSFRKFAKQHNHRFVSTSSLESLPTSKFQYMISSIAIDYAKLKEKGRVVKKILDNGKEVHLYTRKGTDLIFDIKDVVAVSNDGDYSLPGAGGNIPAGEVYMPCNEGGVNGNLVIDGSLRTRETTYLLTKPVTLTIENGSVVKIKGEKAEMLEKSLLWGEETSKRPETVRMIGELGIGINPNARIIGPTIINEKTLGTAHVAIGNNYWFGGTIYSKIHLDHVITEPMIKVDNKAINGILMKI